MVSIVFRRFKVTGEDFNEWNLYDRLESKVQAYGKYKFYIATTNLRINIRISKKTVFMRKLLKISSYYPISCICIIFFLYMITEGLIWKHF